MFIAYFLHLSVVIKEKKHYLCTVFRWYYLGLSGPDGVPGKTAAAAFGQKGERGNPGPDGIGGFPGLKGGAGKWDGN